MRVKHHHDGRDISKPAYHQRNRAVILRPVMHLLRTVISAMLQCRFEKNRSELVW